MFIWVVHYVVHRIKNIKLIFFVQYSAQYNIETYINKRILKSKKMWSYVELDLIVQAFGLEMVFINV